MKQKSELTVRILPVIDIKDGIVVRGVAGERGRYRPVESRLADSHAVIDVADALRDHFQLDDLYIADLDAILSDRPHFSLYAELAARGFRLHVDAGLRDVARGQRLIDEGVTAVIAGLETAPGPPFLAELCATVGSGHAIFSLDLQAGKPMTESAMWNEEPLNIAEQAIAAGVRRMIVLDLAAVGVSGGVSTLDLCGAIRTRRTDIEFITGGGVRNVDDLRTIQRAGVQGVLIASALHNGSITPKDLAAFCAG